MTERKENCLFVSCFVYYQAEIVFFFWVWISIVYIFGKDRWDEIDGYEIGSLHFDIVRVGMHEAWV